MMRYAAVIGLAALSLAGPARAELVWTAGTGYWVGMCFDGRVWFPARGQICVESDAAVSGIALPMAPSWGTGTAFTGSPPPKCAAGWTLVSVAGVPMCARELQQPHD